MQVWVIRGVCGEGCIAHKNDQYHDCTAGPRRLEIHPRWMIISFSFFRIIDRKTLNPSRKRHLQSDLRPLEQIFSTRSPKLSNKLKCYDPTTDRESQRKTIKILSNPLMSLFDRKYSLGKTLFLSTWRFQTFDRQIGRFEGHLIIEQELGFHRGFAFSPLASHPFEKMRSNACF